MTLAQTIRSIRKGRSLTVKANANVTKVTAHRVLGRGKYATTVVSAKRTTVKRLG